MAFLRRGLVNSRTPAHNIHSRKAALAAANETEYQESRQEMERLHAAIDAATGTNDIQPHKMLMSHYLSTITQEPQLTQEERYEQLCTKREHHKNLARQSSFLIRSTCGEAVPQGRVVDVEEIISQASDNKYSSVVLLKCGHTVYSKSIFQAFCPHCK